METISQVILLDSTLEAQIMDKGGKTLIEIRWCGFGFYERTYIAHLMLRFYQE
jgi:hypothetical protein